MAQQSVNHAHYVKHKLAEKGVTVLSNDSVFHEFVVQLSKPVSEVNDRLLEKGFVGGYDVSKEWGADNAMLICVTEKRTIEEMNSFVEALAEEENR